MGDGFTRKAEKVFLFSNDGAKHEAYIVTIQKTGVGDVTQQNRLYTYDYHGQTQTDGSFFIDSGDRIEGILKGDRGGALSEYDDITKVKKGTIAIFKDMNGQIIHSATFNNDQKLTSKNGGFAVEGNDFTIDDIKDVYGEKASFVDDVEDRSLKTLNKTGDSGRAEYSMEEIESAVKSQNNADKHNEESFQIHMEINKESKGKAP